MASTIHCHPLPLPPITNHPVTAFIFKKKAAGSPVIIAPKDYTDDVLAYVVHVPFHGGQYNGALVRVLRGEKPSR